MLKLQNFSRYYGSRQVLFNLHLELQSNEILCVLGPNGAGKTTLLEGILSHHRMGESKIFFEGKEIRTLSEHYEFLQHVSYLGHEPGLFLDFNLLENLQYFLSLYQPKKKDVLDWNQIEFYLKEIQLYSRRFEEVRNYSRGMRQRAGLIRCLITNPKILLLDEPLTGMDFQGQKFLLEFLKDFKKRGSVIVVTHDDEAFEEVADRFIALKKGRIIADIPRKKYTTSAKEKLQELLAS
ncbi:MAG: ABC transporter ATP-binding protein [Leptospiraceae bacterium]|nr:ABC transporter ATP-binding protein [Leptospiraceae bacterium]MDW7976761.1 ABC transporter ATP-binding protein [Leptospiraceae bacterium]